MTRRLICLHGHFYQPPRENPWIEDVEVQDSAAPFHDWNARITAECYGPNGAARLKGQVGRIVDIVNNYRHISFNFGPTLLAWLERRAPEVYNTILDADAHSLQVRGHGNALAQGFNHTILPLCNERDRQTQIRWGLSDFKRRFGRDAEGMWLPETGADLATLRALADEGLRFTVLSPFQAVRVRPPGGEWAEAGGARFDPTRPYLVDLKDGRKFTVFFYDGPIARAVAFGEGLQDGNDLLRRIDSGFDGNRGHDELVCVAVDGETFGHHKKGGDEVLASALRKIAAREDLQLINFGQALELLPVDWEAEIAEGSSWSCSHGLERWKSDCGCQGNGQPGWTQAWRAPLRAALDGLRDRLAELYEREAGKLLLNPWAARDDFATLVLDPERAEAPVFLARHARQPLDEKQQVTALKLLELQRQAMLMYTSCGWFFSEVSGLETVQILKYAARALQLAREVGNDGENALEDSFKEALKAAPSNLSELGDAARVYEAYVKPSVVSLEGVAAHFAISSLFDEFPQAGRIFCFEVAVKERRREAAGSFTLALSRLVLRSLVTRESLDFSVCTLHFSGSDYRCGLIPYDPAGHARAEKALFPRLGQLSLAQILREIDSAFPGRDFTLRDLFLDERRRVAGLLLQDTMRRAEHDFLQIFENNRRLVEFLREISTPVPRPLQVAADVALTWRAGQTADAIAKDLAPLQEAQRDLLGTIELARKLGARVDLTALLPRFEERLGTDLAELARGDDNAAADLAALIDLANRVGMHLDLWEAQNALWALTGSGRFGGDRDDLLQLARAFWFEESVLIARVARAPRRGPEAEPAAAAV